MMHKLELFVVLFVSLNTANSLQCYHCFEALELGCYSGNNDTMWVANCRNKNESCITYKWETYHHGTSTSYVTTIRGCEREEICEKLLIQKVSNFRGGTEQKGISCHVCQTDLCNSSCSNEDHTKFVFFLAISASILLYHTAI